MLQKQELDFLAARFAPWGALSESERALLTGSASPVAYRRGTTLHRGDENCLGLLLVRSGSLRVYLLSEEGREVTLYRLRAGDLCVMSASCVLSEITFDVHIDAEEDTEALLIGAAAFAQLTEQNLQVRCFAYQLAVERFSDVMWAMQQILFLSMDRRLARLLWDELTTQGTDTLRLTHEQAARYLGSAREVVTRMLRYFAAEGIVELSRGGIHILDRARLRALAE